MTQFSLQGNYKYHGEYKGEKFSREQAIRIIRLLHLGQNNNNSTSSLVIAVSCVFKYKQLLHAWIPLREGVGVANNIMSNYYGLTPFWLVAHVPDIQMMSYTSDVIII